MDKIVFSAEEFNQLNRFLKKRFGTTGEATLFLCNGTAVILSSAVTSKQCSMEEARRQLNQCMITMQQTFERSLLKGEHPGKN